MADGPHMRTTTAPRSTRIRVLLVDDQPAVRWLLRSTLEADERFQIVGEAGDGVDAIRYAESIHPDLALMDLAMPNLDGLQAIEGMRRGSPETRVLVLSGHAESMAGLVGASGADGFVQKGTGPAVLIREIARLFPEVFGAVAEEPRPEPEPQPVPPHLSFLMHEMQGALTIIGGFAATLRLSAERMDPEQLRAYAEPIERRARELSALINRLPETLAAPARRRSA
jgi:CheY-like chemotaxis protein